MQLKAIFCCLIFLPGSLQETVTTVGESLLAADHPISPS